MKNPVKTVVYDHTLRLEAYYFAGIAQPFPNHFHEYYVIGLVEQGAAPMEAALLTGFSDQSHFTNCFSRLIGLPPGAYREIYTEKQKDGAT